MRRPILVAGQSKALVCVRFVARIAGSNSDEVMDVCLLCIYIALPCVGTGLYDGLIARPEESYRVSNCVCDQETSVQRRTKPKYGL
jgi:hypothetical protein